MHTESQLYKVRVVDLHMTSFMLNRYIVGRILQLSYCEAESCRSDVGMDVHQIGDVTCSRQPSANCVQVARNQRRVYTTSFYQQ